jgi:hypothetical protein
VAPRVYQKPPPVTESVQVERDTLLLHLFLALKLMGGEGQGGHDKVQTKERQAARERFGVALLSSPQGPHLLMYQTSVQSARKSQYNNHIVR